MKILFVDDEQRRMKPVIAEIEFRGHNVTFESTVDPALVRLGDSRQQFDLVILDVSMPSGKEFGNLDTDGGARTGVSFYGKLRAMCPSLKVVVYTNVADRGVEQYFEKENRMLCRFIRKPSVLPFEFVDEIEKFVSPSE